jgi:hypothetical protein
VHTSWQRPKRQRLKRRLRAAGSRSRKSGAQQASTPLSATEATQQWTQTSEHNREVVKHIPKKLGAVLTMKPTAGRSQRPSRSRSDWNPFSRCPRVKESGWPERCRRLRQRLKRLKFSIYDTRTHTRMPSYTATLGRYSRYTGTRPRLTCTFPSRIVATEAWLSSSPLSRCAFWHQQPKRLERPNPETPGLPFSHPSLPHCRPAILEYGVRDNRRLLCSYPEIQSLESLFCGPPQP